ncbi:MAG TPA: winged helix-turn-helix domain-containing protein [Pyrinomonadaceae bacterium]|nr:winged helix-turn-helix domain-containing protein [Pyrinomonadaceae bacterium]
MRSLHFDGFAVDPARRTVSRDGRTLPLTAKAFDTLLFLLDNPGKTVTKQDIMDAVWADTAVEENNLTQQISALRKVFGACRGDHKFIVTVPGKGYSFIAAVTSSDNAPIVRRPAFGETLVGKLTFAAGFLLLSLSVGYLTITAKARTPTIAVLAFHSVDGSNDSLGAGMRYPLTAKLGNLEEVVNVRPTDSLPHADPLLAGRELAVDTVLDGTIQHDGDRIRVTVQMVDVAGGRVMWAKSIDAEAAQNFSTQDAIAAEVVAGLTEFYARG